MAYSPKYLALLAASSLAVTALGAGCSRDVAEGDGAASNLGATNSDLVISQVFGGGGMGNDAIWMHDYVELRNKGTQKVHLGGKALQFARPDEAFSKDKNVLPLPERDLEPGQYFLIELLGGETGPEGQVPDQTTLTGKPFDPPADFEPEVGDRFNLGNKEGSVALVDLENLLDGCGGAAPATPVGPDTPSPPDTSDSDNGGSGNEPAPATACTWIDLVGYSATDSTTKKLAEGDAPALGATKKKALVRTGSGCADSNNNQLDFTTAAPTPRTTKTADVTKCSPGTTDEVGPVAERVLLNELLINPPGDQDHESPWEFVELACQPANASLKGYYFVVVDGKEGSGANAAEAPGKTKLVVNLGTADNGAPAKCGSKGLVLIKAVGGGHASMEEGTTVIETPLLAGQNGRSTLQNNTTSFLVIKSPKQEILPDTDYSSIGAAGEGNGELDLLKNPNDPGNEATIVDGISTYKQRDDKKDITYAPRLQKVPDACSRIPGNDKPLDASAWYSASMATEATDPKGLAYNPKSNQSSNFPTEGYALSPGAQNGARAGTDNRDDDQQRDEVDDEHNDPGSSAVNPPGTGGKQREERTKVPATKTGSRSACAMVPGPTNGSALTTLGALGLVIATLGRRRRK